jgi:hypothetical protein
MLRSDNYKYVELYSSDLRVPVIINNQSEWKEMIVNARSRTLGSDRCVMELFGIKHDELIDITEYLL